MKKVHIAGIGGEGWSWIAKVLIEKGWQVEGCDIQENERVEFLKSIGLQKFHTKNNPAHLHKDLDYFLYTSALVSSPVGILELEKSKKLNIPSYDRNAFLPILMADHEVIAIAGTHGKTTTTSMTSYLLDALGNKCGFGIGGTSKNFNTNGRNGNSETFVIEADEFADAFLGLNPQIAVITSMEMDHHDYFKDFEAYKKSFEKFISQVKPDGFVIAFGDSDELFNMLKDSPAEVLTYGEKERNSLTISDIRINGFNTSWKIKWNGESYNAEIPFPGKQYAYNATAALAVCIEKGFEISKAINLLKEFKGTGRRFDHFEQDGITIVNDYGHHPTELKITLDGAIATGKKVLVVFEPHQYKRSLELKDMFKGIFSRVDNFVQTEIFASREDPPYAIRNEDFFDACKTGTKKSEYIGSWQNVAPWIQKNAKSDDLVLLMAVGHGSEIISQLKNIL